TNAEFKTGRYTGKIDGIACFREGKVTRVQHWLKSLGTSLEQFETSYFYSDSLNDTPLLEAVTHPVATNPAPGLRTHAQANGWTILDLFPPEQADAMAATATQANQ